MSTDEERQSLIQKINSLTALIQNATEGKQNKNYMERSQQASTSRYKAPQRESKSNLYSSRTEPMQSSVKAADSHIWVKNKLITKKDCSDIKEVAFNAQNPTTSSSSYQTGSIKKIENINKSSKKEELENKLRETEENIRKLKMCITQKKEIQKKTEMSLCTDSKAASKASDKMVFDKSTLPRRPGHIKEFKTKSITPISDLITSNIHSWSHEEHTQCSSDGRMFNKKNVLKPESSDVQWKPLGIRKDTSITPISDLITKNLQREQAIRLGQNHPVLRNQQIKKHEKLKYDQPYRNQHKHSAFKKNPLKLNLKSVTPISDQITRNLAKKKTPKYLKFSKDKKWTKNKSSLVCNTQSFSGQLSWQQSQSRTDNMYTWQSKTSKSQRAANGIKSKYRISYTPQRNQSWKSKAKHASGNTRTWGRFSYTGFYGRYKGSQKHGNSTRNFKYSTWIKGESWRYKQKVKRLHNTTLKKSRYQLDKRGQLPEVRSGQVTRAMASVLQGQCLVMIDGRVYRTSQSQLAGSHASPSQARRGRISMMKKSFSFTPQVNRKWKSQHLAKTINSHNITTRILASRVLQRSIQTAATKFKKKKTEQYCMFYNRFGKCNRGDKCKYIHDPEKVAVCTRFLRGTCNIVDCPFSHKVDKDKMPVCSYFLRGVCSRDNCPYLHVKVSKNAEVCQDFLQGFCSKGAKCKKRHTLTCQVFAATGSCPDGDKCRLKHQKIRKRKPSEANTKNAVSEKSHGDVDEVSDNIPLKQRKLPAYISISKTSGGQKVDSLPPVETSGQNKSKLYITVMGEFRDPWLHT